MDFADAMNSIILLLNSSLCFDNSIDQSFNVSESCTRIFIPRSQRPFRPCIIKVSPVFRMFRRRRSQVDRFRIEVAALTKLEHLKCFDIAVSSSNV